MADLSGKVAVVLGASAEGGTGWTIAETLADAGMKVVVGARRREHLDRLAARIGGVAQTCDASKPDDIARLAQVAVEQFGPLSLAINAAGNPSRGSVADVADVAIREPLETEYIGNIHFIRHMAAEMHDGGSIVLFSSTAAERPAPAYLPYACAKAALDCLVRYAAIEYGDRGIRVNSIRPGLIRSPMAESLFATPGAEDLFIREVPLGRVGLPSDFADAVLWLAGSPYLTGAHLPINGGRQLTRSTRAEEIAALQATD